MSLSSGEIVGGGNVRDEDARVITRRPAPGLLIENGESFKNTTGKTLRVVSAFVEITTPAGVHACSHLRILAPNAVSTKNHLFVDNTAIQPEGTSAEHQWAVGVTPGEHKEAGPEPVFIGVLPPDLYLPVGAELVLQVKVEGGEAVSAGWVLVFEELP